MLMETEIGKSIRENSMEVPQEIQDRIVTWPSSPMSEHMSKRNGVSVMEWLHITAALFPYSKYVETT